MNARVFQMLADLDLPADKLKKVLAVFAELQASHDASRDASRDEIAASREASRLRSRKYRENKGRVTSPSRDASRDAPILELGGVSSFSLSLEESTEEGSKEDSRVVVARETASKIARGWMKFWSAYPHKVGKAAAQKEFGKAYTRATLDEIMAGLDVYAHKTDDRPWCNPSTWLHQDRWKDKPAPPVQKTRSWKDERDEKSWRDYENLKRAAFGTDDEGAGDLVGDAPYGELHLVKNA